MCPIRGHRCSVILFENPASIQLHHRILAMASFYLWYYLCVKIPPCLLSGFFGIVSVAIHVRDYHITDCACGADGSVASARGDCFIDADMADLSKDYEPNW